MSCNETKEKKAAVVTETESTLNIYPISHATAVLTSGKTTIYIDPTGGKEAFANYAAPTVVFITDIHGDHMSIKTLQALDLTATTLIAPAAVIEKLPADIAKTLVTLNNGDSIDLPDLKAEAIPMYNLREEALRFHSKGRGNGYVLTLAGERLYFSGDTEDIPEMRALQNIDRAFVCMNLPYTMTVESAASAVLEFSPKKIYPYHYRGTNGMIDVAKFKQLVNDAQKDIEVVQLNWYQ